MYDQEVVTTFQWKHDGAYDEPALQALCDAMDLFWGTEFTPTLGAQYSYVRTVVTGLEFNPDTQVESHASSGGGTNEGTFLPNNVTFSIKRWGTFTGRSARGRIYVPGIIQEFCVDTNHLLEAKADAWLDLLNELVEPTFAADWTHVVWSYQFDKAPRDPAYPYIIANYTWVDLTLDSQRRRLPGRGV